MLASWWLKKFIIISLRESFSSIESFHCWLRWIRGISIVCFIISGFFHSFLGFLCPWGICLWVIPAFSYFFLFFLSFFLWIIIFLGFVFKAPIFWNSFFIFIFHTLLLLLTFASSKIFFAFIILQTLPNNIPKKHLLKILSCADDCYYFASTLETWG